MYINEWEMETEMNERNHFSILFYDHQKKCVGVYKDVFVRDRFALQTP